MIVGDYVAPRSLEEAARLIGDGRSARALAGGNALLVEPSRRQLAQTTLVDLRRIPGLAGVQQQDGGLRIGAMTTLAALAAAAERYPALAEAIQSIGDAQVRNRATVGGSLAEGDPGNDLPAVMIALGAQVQVQGAGGSRMLSADDLQYGGRRVSELITAVILPPPAARSGSAYEKVRHPATLYAICGVAASLTLGADGNVSACGLAVTGAAEAPTKLTAAENTLKGRRADEAGFATAAERLGELRWRGDHFASAEYRRHLTSVLVQRALARAAARASQ